MVVSPDSAEARLAQSVSDAVARLFLEKFGKGPLYVRTHMTGDVVTTVMRGYLTQVEDALIAASEEQSVLVNRMLWQAATDRAFKETVGAVLGREVVTVISGFSLPDGVATEVFLLAPR